MFLHLGNNVIISSQNIIAILNLEPPISPDLQDIIEIAKQEKKLTSISETGKEKSLVVANDRVYISPISSTTLYKRGLSYFKEG